MLPLCRKVLENVLSNKRFLSCVCMVTLLSYLREWDPKDIEGSEDFSPFCHSWKA